MPTVPAAPSLSTQSPHIEASLGWAQKVYRNSNISGALYHDWLAPPVFERRAQQFSQKFSKRIFGSDAQALSGAVKQNHRQSAPSGGREPRPNALGFLANEAARQGLRGQSRWAAGVGALMSLSHKAQHGSQGAQSTLNLLSLFAPGLAALPQFGVSSLSLGQALGLQLAANVMGTLPSASGFWPSAGCAWLPLLTDKDVWPALPVALGLAFLTPLSRILGAGVSRLGAAGASLALLPALELVFGHGPPPDDGMHALLPEPLRAENRADQPIEFVIEGRDRLFDAMADLPQAPQTPRDPRWSRRRAQDPATHEKIILTELAVDAAIATDSSGRAAMVPRALALVATTEPAQIENGLKRSRAYEAALQAYDSWHIASSVWLTQIMQEAKEQAQWLKREAQKVGLIGLLTETPLRAASRVAEARGHKAVAVTFLGAACVVSCVMQLPRLGVVLLTAVDAILCAAAGLVLFGLSWGVNETLLALIRLRYKTDSTAAQKSSFYKERVQHTIGQRLLLGRPTDVEEGFRSLARQHFAYFISSPTRMARVRQLATQLAEHLVPNDSDTAAQAQRKQLLSCHPAELSNLAALLCDLMYRPDHQHVEAARDVALFIEHLLFDESVIIIDDADDSAVEITFLLMALWSAVRKASAGDDQSGANAHLGPYAFGRKLWQPHASSSHHMSPRTERQFRGLRETFFEMLDDPVIADAVTKLQAPSGESAQQTSY